MSRGCQGRCQLRSRFKCRLSQRRAVEWHEHPQRSLYMGTRTSYRCVLVQNEHGHRGMVGNLLGDPRAGLIFIDFASGDILQLQGTVTIDWHPNGGPAGAERLWQVRVERAWRRRGAFPFTWTFGDYAPTTLKTGVW